VAKENMVYIHTYIYILYIYNGILFSHNNEILSFVAKEIWTGRLYVKRNVRAKCWLPTPAIIATWEAETRSLRPAWANTSQDFISKRI
jgi:hypothetical protein